MKVTTKDAERLAVAELSPWMRGDDEVAKQRRAEAIVARHGVDGARRVVKLNEHRARRSERERAELEGRAMPSTWQDRSRPGQLSALPSPEVAPPEVAALIVEDGELAGRIGAAREAVEVARAGLDRARAAHTAKAARALRDGKGAPKPVEVEKAEAAVKAGEVEVETLTVARATCREDLVGVLAGAAEAWAGRLAAAEAELAGSLAGSLSGLVDGLDELARLRGRRRWVVRGGRGTLAPLPVRSASVTFESHSDVKRIIRQIAAELTAEAESDE